MATKTVRRKSTLKRKTSVKKSRKRKVSAPKPVIIIQKERSDMPARKRRKSSGSSTRKAPRKRGFRGISGSSGSSRKFAGMTKNLTNQLTDGLVGASSAVIVTTITAKIPNIPPKIKALIPLVAGIVLANMAKGKNARLINAVSFGSVIAGTLAVVKQFVPAFTLAGENEMYQQYLPNNSQNSLLGIPAEFAGNSEGFSLEDAQVVM